MLSLSNPGQAIAAHLDDSLADMPQEIGFGRGAHHGVMTSADRGQRPMRSVQLIFRLYTRWARATLLGRRHVAPAAAPAFAARVHLAHMRRQLAGQREQGYVARASGAEARRQRVEPAAWIATDMVQPHVVPCPLPLSYPMYQTVSM